MSRPRTIARGLPLLAALWLLPAEAAPARFEGSASLAAPRASAGARFELSARLQAQPSPVDGPPHPGRFQGKGAMAATAATAACGPVPDLIHANGFE